MRIRLPGAPRSWAALSALALATCAGVLASRSKAVTAKPSGVRGASTVPARSADVGSASSQGGRPLEPPESARGDDGA
ncbi:MAG: hypothetical protein FWD17_18500, partial [Polyangiaceae bacterium]|nr:hypothetical protein [Polyangiaceae bacterium]